MDITRRKNARVVEAPESASLKRVAIARRAVVKAALPYYSRQESVRAVMGMAWKRAALTHPAAHARAVGGRFIGGDKDAPRIEVPEAFVMSN